MVRIVGQWNRLSGSHYDYQLNRFKEHLSAYKKMVKTLIEPRGFKETDNLKPIEESLKKEIDGLKVYLEEVESDEFQRNLAEQIREKKRKLSVTGKSISDRVKEFSSLNHLLSYKFKDVDHTVCLIPEKEFTGRKDAQKEVGIEERKRRMKIAKGKAKAQEQRIRILKLK